jgi:hypothetical protein
MDSREEAAAKHKMAFDAIGFAAQVLTPNVEALQALVEAERRMHSYLHITDPTLYMRAMDDKGLKVQVKLAEAALRFIKVVQECKDELGPPAAIVSA